VITAAALRESVRRKDLYVALLLAAFAMGVELAFIRIGLPGLTTLLRDMTLTVVNILATMGCIILAARQLPEEISRRTLYPLLARPIRRTDVLLGKFLAVWLLSGLLLGALAGGAWLYLRTLGMGYGPIFWQYVLLRLLSFGVISALVMTLSLLTTPGATILLGAMLTLGATFFAQSIVLGYPASGRGLQFVLQWIYYAAPHLDLLDLSRKTAYNWPPLSAGVILTLAGYALAYAGVFLAWGAARFRKMAI